MQRYANSPIRKHLAESTVNIGSGESIKVKARRSIKIIKCVISCSAREVKNRIARWRGKEIIRINDRIRERED